MESGRLRIARPVAISMIGARRSVLALSRDVVCPTKSSAPAACVVRASAKSYSFCPVRDKRAIRRPWTPTPALAPQRRPTIRPSRRSSLVAPSGTCWFGFRGRQRRGIRPQKKTLLNGRRWAIYHVAPHFRMSSLPRLTNWGIMTTSRTQGRKFGRTLCTCKPVVVFIRVGIGRENFDPY